MTGPGPLGPYVLQNTWMHDNRVVMRRGTTGLSSSDERSYSSRRNQFRDNRYTVIGFDATSFAWGGAELTWAQWRQQGQDLGGTYSREGAGRAIASR
jgi:hypothetical protein